MKPPIPPPSRILREGGAAYSGFCDICGSSLKRRWFGLGKVIGCLQPKCWNWHGWSNLPVGHNRPIDLYGAPEKPPYQSQLPMPKRYPPMPAVKPLAPQPLPCECKTYCRHGGYPDPPLRRGFYCCNQPNWCPTCTKPYAECRCNEGKDLPR